MTFCARGVTGAEAAGCVTGVAGASGVAVVVEVRGEEPVVAAAGLISGRVSPPGPMEVGGTAGRPALGEPKGVAGRGGAGWGGAAGVGEVPCRCIAEDPGPGEAAFPASSGLAGGSAGELGGRGVVMCPLPRGRHWVWISQVSHEPSGSDRTVSDSGARRFFFGLRGSLRPELRKIVSASMGGRSPVCAASNSKITPITVQGKGETPDARLILRQAWNGILRLNGLRGRHNKTRF